ncbi:hypothetical protein BH11PSE11_BH11PSE11_16440 [soil metagenome]
MKTAIFKALMLLCLAGCTFKDNTNPVETIKSHGITYQFPPQQNSSSSDSGAAFAFTSESLNFTEKNGKLIVNGKEFGEAKVGDTVSIDSIGEVYVNGIARSQQ